MMRLIPMFLFYFFSTAGLIASIFILGNATLVFEGLTIIGVILVTNVIVIALQMRH